MTYIKIGVGKLSSCGVSRGGEMGCAGAEAAQSQKEQMVC